MTITDIRLPEAGQDLLDNFYGAIRHRRSVRKLTGGPLSDKTLRTILDAGRWAPSSKNSQPWRMVVLRERHAEFWDFVAESLREKLPQESYERALKRIEGYRPGLFTIVFYEDTTIAANPGGSNPEVWKSYAVQAMGMVQANVWNTIAAAGLAASNQHLQFPIEAELRAYLGVPETWKSYSIFPVGYAAETPGPKDRHPFNEVVHLERGPHG